MAKQYFDKLGVKYEDKNVEYYPTALSESVQKSGQRGIPVIDIDGTIIIGFNRPAIDQALKEKKLT
jgi:glutaredoxin 3